MKLKIRKGDNVELISGSEKGRSGKVLRVYSKTQRILIEGINVRKRHTRPTQSAPQGGVITKERPVHYSNVKLVEAAAKAASAKAKKEKKPAKSASK